MQNHHSLLYREEEREMLPLLRVCPPQVETHISIQSRSYRILLAPRRRMYPMEPLGKR